jgi:hypothetical protein
MPAAHRLVAAVERLRGPLPLPPLRHRATLAPMTPTVEVVERWTAREARRRLRGSAGFLDLHPESGLPALAAASALDRPGRVIMVLDADRVDALPERLWDSSIRPSVHVVVVDPADPDTATTLRSHGATLLPRTVSWEHPAAAAVISVDVPVASLVDAVPRFDLVRVRADRMTATVAATLQRMTAERRIARLLITLDPFAMSAGVDAAVDMVAHLEEHGLPVTLGPWLVEGRGRTWREHLRVAARPFVIAIGA